MTVVIDKNTDVKELDKLLLKLKTGKKLKAKKYCGSVKWGEDALDYQKKLRNEWS